MRVQDADTVSFQALAPHSDLAKNRGPSVSPTLYSIDGKVRPHLIYGMRKYIGEKKRNPHRPVESVGLV